jgi:hypothetical protein
MPSFSAALLGVHSTGAQPYTVVIPSAKVAKWGPLAGTCLKYAAGAAGVLPVGGSLAHSACSAAAEYVDKVSDLEGKQALEGMEPGEKQALVG